MTAKSQTKDGTDTGGVYVKGGDLEWGEEYFIKALRVDQKDKLAKKGLGELKEMSRK